MKFIAIAVFCFSASLQQVCGQATSCSRGRLDAGLELQCYPAGFIPTLTANFFAVNNVALRVRLGGNFANRTGLSPYNQYERAKGYGGSAGLVTYFPYKHGHFTTGITTDVWRMWTNWQNDQGTPTASSGTTYTFVLQPWADAGYLYQLKNTRTNLGLTLGFGKEINVVTKGKPVGQGWMGSATITLNHIIRN